MVVIGYNQGYKGSYEEMGKAVFMTPRAMSPDLADLSSDATLERNLLRCALCLVVSAVMFAGLISRTI